MRKSPIRKVLLALGFLFLLGFIGVNVLAYNHAYAMTHFSKGGAKTGKPEALRGVGKLRILFSGVNIPRPETGATPRESGLAYETVRIAVDADVTLEAWYIPAARTNDLVLAFHGYASEKSRLLPECKLLNEMGYPVLLVNFRGSGGSSGSMTTIGYREADDVTAACRYAARRWPERGTVVLFGCSMGAAAILRAIAYDQVSPSNVIIEGVFDSLLHTVRNRFRAMRVPPFPSAELLVFWGSVQAGFNGFRHNPVEYASKVRCPVLFMNGSRDPRVVPAEAESVYRRIGSPKEIKTFLEAGHESYASLYPEEWKATVSSFLASHAGKVGTNAK